MTIATSPCIHACSPCRAGAPHPPGRGRQRAGGPTVASPSLRLASKISNQFTDQLVALAAVAPEVRALHIGHGVGSASRQRDDVIDARAPCVGPVDSLIDRLLAELADPSVPRVHVDRRERLISSGLGYERASTCVRCGSCCWIPMPPVPELLMPPLTVRPLLVSEPDSCVPPPVLVLVILLPLAHALGVEGALTVGRPTLLAPGVVHGRATEGAGIHFVSRHAEGPMPGGIGPSFLRGSVAGVFGEWGRQRGRRPTLALLPVYTFTLRPGLAPEVRESPDARSIRAFHLVGHAPRTSGGKW